jgi:hypothetical protein
MRLRGSGGKFPMKRLDSAEVKRMADEAAARAAFAAQRYKDQKHPGSETALRRVIGEDDYLVKFANGDTECKIMPRPDGKIQSLGYRPYSFPNGSACAVNRMGATAQNNGGCRCGWRLIRRGFRGAVDDEILHRPFLRLQPEAKLFP